MGVLIGEVGPRDGLQNEDRVLSTKVRAELCDRLAAAGLKRIEAANQIAYFMAAEEVKWRKLVVPGDVLVIEIELTKVRGKIGKAKGVCKVAGEVVSEAEVTFMLRDA